MGLFDNVRQRLAGEASGPVSPNSTAGSDVRYATLPDDNYQRVVGESFYQETLEATAELCTLGEDDRPVFVAYVIAEPDNPYDRDAVAVHSERGKVGHLSRDDARSYREVMAAVSAQGYTGVTCTAFLNGGRSDAPNYGVVLKLARAELCELHLGIASDPPVTRTAASSVPMRATNSDAGHLRGKHYTTYVDEIRVLRRHGHDDSAEVLLLELLTVVETESAATGYGVAPWYYEQLAIAYRKRKDYPAEVAVLERFAGQSHAPGVSPPKLLQRLEKARELAERAG